MLKYFNGNENIRLIASERNWIEGIALEQLQNTAKLPDMNLVVGLPDLHPGKGNPIGAAFISQNTLYPYLVGGDIGCGIALWQSSLNVGKIKRDNLVKKLMLFNQPWNEPIEEFLAERQVQETSFDNSLGTIGGGNHFAELQIVEEIKNQTLFSALNLSKDQVMLLVHSGSRGLGKFILDKYISQYSSQGLKASSEAAEIYLKEHNNAAGWAKANRELIAKRFFKLLNADGTCVLDICHNSVTEALIDGCKCWLHRKGAAPSDKGPVVIPGSRGSFSYLVNPIGDKQFSAFSLAHGAGRKWTRHESKKRLSKNYKPDFFKQTKLGSKVICENKDLLYEEAPQAYKNIEIVIDDLVNVGLIEVIAILRPLITYKTGL